MFRVLEFHDGKVDLFEGTDHVGPPPPGVVARADQHLAMVRRRDDPARAAAEIMAPVSALSA
mgnify:CR=1 FL=1